MAPAAPNRTPKRKKTAKLQAAKPARTKASGAKRASSRGRQSSARGQSGKRNRKTQKLERQAGPRTKKQIAWRISKWLALGGLVCAAVFALAIAFLFWWHGRDLPTTFESMSDYAPIQVSRVTSRDGTVVGELYTERRTFVAYDKIPTKMVEAIVSAEDADFFQHEGIDYFGMVRALFVNLKSGKKKQGASTITQQVVKTFLLSPERTLKRKFQEIILARRLEQRLSKEKILELYLNQIYFGGGRYGVQEAARYYFGKDLQELNVGEIAVIAGLPQSPENLNPRKEKNHERVKLRQIYVLREMSKHGYISAKQADAFARQPIAIIEAPFPFMGDAPEWIDLARHELTERHGDDGYQRLGAVVRTTLDLEVQRFATESLRKGLRELDERHHYGGVVRRLKDNKIKLELVKLARKLPKKGPAKGKRYQAVVISVHDKDRELVVNLGNYQASILLGGKHDHADKRRNPEGKKPSERFARGDVVRVLNLAAPKRDSKERRAAKHSERQVRLESGPDGAVVVLDPRTREVLALVGGYRSVVSGYNRATMAKRQPGSTFKPFVYAAAIDSGDYTSASIINDAPEVYDLWKPQNYKKGQHEGPVRLRHALAKSINTVAIRVAHDIGPEQVASLAQTMGIQSNLPSTLSLALGSGEVNPLELTNAFATFAAGGRYAPPRFIASVGDDAVAARPSVQALRPETAYVVTQMMRSVVEDGTGKRARALRLRVAGKTGTSNDARDAWFIGMTPDLVIGVWIGFDNNQPLGRREGGGRSAVPVFVDLVKQLRQKRPMRSRKFSRPAGVIEARIDKLSGKLAAEGAASANTYSEVFLSGTVPTERATAPGQVDADTYGVDVYDDVYDTDGETDPPPPDGDGKVSPSRVRP